MAEAPDPMVERILTLFPGPITVKSLTLVSVTIAVVLTAVVIASFEAFLIYHGPAPFQLLFALLGIAGLSFALLRGARRMSLNAEGFAVRSLIGDRFTGWRDIAGFDVIQIRKGRGAVVPMVFCRAYQDASPGSGNLQSTNRLFGGDGVSAMSAVDYGFLSRSIERQSLSAYKLAQLMNLWRDRALAVRR